MSTTSTKRAAESSRTPRKSLTALKITAVVTLLSTVAQPILAGMFLDHNVSALSMHQANAGILHLLQFVQLIVAGLYWRPGGGRGWPLSASTALWLAAGAQFALGEAANLTIHLPLGVMILILQGCLTVWAMRQGAVVRVPDQRSRRPPRPG